MEDRKYITPDIIEINILENYCIYIKFGNNEEKIYNMKTLIESNKFYNNLKDKQYFKKLKIRGDTLEWSSGEDIAPENLYYDSVPIGEFKGEIKELE